MNELIKRALTGALIVIVLITAICIGEVGLIAMTLVLTIMGLWEFYLLAETGGHQPLKITGVLSGFGLALLLALFSHGYIDLHSLNLIIPLFSLVLVVELFRKSDSPLVNIGTTLLGILYVALPFALINFLAYPPTQLGPVSTSNYTPNILLGFFFLLWTNDSFAYLAGVQFGKHRLYESVSPKKSWEGSIGGAICCLACAYLISHYFQDIDLFHWMIISAMVASTDDFFLISLPENRFTFTQCLLAKNKIQAIKIRTAITSPDAVTIL